ncbi:hypothetical protein KZ810_11540 [Sphingomonas sp. RHCKR47]|uniref:hypothetical protein n=1 Tax=Sphingomonas citricola TaxID=2862498 RepID=UPI001CA480BC|nr:hypothetical protein [Sphingomonas citricola]MBW6524130.1 hypothetical protein [Sphingomonas citricola]
MSARARLRAFRTLQYQAEKLLPPYIGCTLAGCLSSPLREKTPALFWLSASIYAVAALFFAVDAIAGFFHG